MQEPIILENKIFRLLGCVYYGDPFHEAEEWSYENEIGKLWQRFMDLSFKKYARLLRKICVDNNIAYELHLEPEEYMNTKKYYVFIGMEVESGEEVPLEMFIKVLPKIDYIVFTTTIENKQEQGRYIYKTWLPENGLVQSFPYIIQLYDQRRYRGLEDPKSEIDWYIPVKKSR
ncbi:MAG: GyrI-like domain-containing protein [Candidatus Thorarchaeota archaeon]